MPGKFSVQKGVRLDSLIKIEAQINLLLSASEIAAFSKFTIPNTTPETKTVRFRVPDIARAGQFIYADLYFTETSINWVVGDSVLANNQLGNKSVVRTFVVDSTSLTNICICQNADILFLGFYQEGISTSFCALFPTQLDSTLWNSYSSGFTAGVNDLSYFQCCPTALPSMNMDTAVYLHGVNNPLFSTTNNNGSVTIMSGTFLEYALEGGILCGFSAELGITYTGASPLFSLVVNGANRYLVLTRGVGGVVVKV